MPDLPPAGYQERLSLLVAELHEVRHRGGPARVFDDLEDNGPLDLPVLFETVRHLYRDEWAAEGRRTEAIRHVLEDAILALPTHNLPGASERSLSWQEAALILFNIRVPDKAWREIQDYNGRESARLARYVREACAIYPLDETTRRKSDRQFQDIVLRMRKLMAERSLKAVPGIGSDTPQEPVEAPETDTQKPPVPAAEKASKFNMVFHHVERNYVADSMTFHDGQDGEG